MTNNQTINQQTNVTAKQSENNYVTEIDILPNGPGAISEVSTHNEEEGSSSESRNQDVITSREESSMIR